MATFRVNHTACEHVASPGREGSLTVEAAFVMPMVLGVVVFLMYLGFFIHDRCILAACGREAACFGAYTRVCGNARSPDEVAAADDEFLGGKLFMFSGSEIRAEVSDPVEVTARAIRGIPQIPTLRQLLDAPGISLETEAHASGMWPEEILRKSRALIEWGEVILK